MFVSFNKEKICLSFAPCFRKEKVRESTWEAAHFLDTPFFINYTKAADHLTSHEKAVCHEILLKHKGTERLHVTITCQFIIAGTRKHRNFKTTKHYRKHDQQILNVSIRCTGLPQRHMWRVQHIEALWAFATAVSCSIHCPVSQERQKKGPKSVILAGFQQEIRVSHATLTTTHYLAQNVVSQSWQYSLCYLFDAKINLIFYSILKILSNCVAW